MLLHPFLLQRSNTREEEEDKLVSGGSSRSDGKASFGYAQLRGRRASQEDAVAAQWSPLPPGAGGSGGGGGSSTTSSSGAGAGGGSNDGGGCSDVGLFAVFDGHGGPGAAEFASQHLLGYVLRSGAFATDPAAAMVEAFEQADADYMNEPPTAASDGDDGCTATAAALVGRRLFVANAGDSRAVLCRGGKAVPMSVDHKPQDAAERARIEAAGGVVAWAGTWRVQGVLAVSRAIGDRPLKRYVISRPDVVEEALTPKDDCLILATDGVWDVVDNAEACRLVSGADARRAARKLVEAAHARGSLDNISAVVVKFKF